MPNGIHKKILNKMPAGVFAFDNTLKVLYVNEAFGRFFPALKKVKNLKDVLSCKEDLPCGKGSACAFCDFYSAMKETVLSGSEQMFTTSISIPSPSRNDTLNLRVRTFPADNKKKLFFGIADGVYTAEIEREMLSAKKIQQRLLPSGKKTGNFAYSFMYIPCLEIGGDLPDVYELDGETYGILSDVSGKGISAGMLSAFVKAGFDKNQKSLAKALTGLSEKFATLNPDERSYITVAAVRLNKQEMKMHYSVAGHNAPILLKNEDGINEIESPAPPISNWITGYEYRENEIPFKHGDMLVLLTDGVTECENSVGELFGIERAESVLVQSQNAEDFIVKLRNALNVFSGGKFSDDITSIAFDL